jgi:hypothetical protein
MRFDYQTPLQHITIYIIYKDLQAPHSRMYIMKCLGNFLEENVKVDKTRCGHQLLLQNTKHEKQNTKSKLSTRGEKMHGCKGRGCHLKSHSESANHWSLCPHKITGAYCTLRVSVLSVRHHPLQTDCQKHPYYADVNGICTCNPQGRPDRNCQLHCLATVAAVSVV